MVAIVGCSETQVRDNFDNTNLTSDPQCICCKHLQHELETVILELQSAKKIIEFLYAEINSSAQHTYAYKVKMPHLYPVLFIMIVRRILPTF